jgi:hypothetical protein
MVFLGFPLVPGAAPGSARRTILDIKNGLPARPGRGPRLTPGAGKRLSPERAWTVELTNLTMRPITGVRLLHIAMAATLPAGSPRPDYSRFIPPGWRANGLTRQAVQDRMTILERTGARLFVERLRLEWRHDYNPIIAYLAVLPEHRGNGYINDILTEGTRILARHEVPRIRASTDLGNTLWRTPSSVPDTSISNERSK